MKLEVLEQVQMETEKRQRKDMQLLCIMAGLSAGVLIVLLWWACGYATGIDELALQSVLR